MIEPFPIYRDKLLLKQLDFIPTHSARETRLHSFSTVIRFTSNLIFSQWEQIFKDPMTTAAAIDRLVHHSVIVELNLPSYRLKAATQKKEMAAAATAG